MKFAYLSDAPLMASPSGHRLDRGVLDAPIATSKGLNGASTSIGLHMLIAVSGVFVGSHLDALGLDMPAEAPQEMGPVMTYNGMDLAAFAVFIGMPADHPYTIAAFEDMCSPETTG